MNPDVSEDENNAALGTMTAHLYLRVGSDNLREIATAEVQVGPTIKLDAALADMFEAAATTLREGRRG